MSLNTYSLDLEASSSQFAFITDANQTGLDITGDMTFELWFKPESSPASGQTMCFVSKYGTAGAHANNRSYQLQYFNNAGSYQIGMNVSTNGTVGASGGLYVGVPQFTHGVWVHIALVFTASLGKIEVFTANVSRGTNTSARTSIFAGTADFVIGAAAEGASSFVDGCMDEVRIWNTARSAAQISANYQTQLVGNEAGLVGYWKFNNDYTSATPNGNNLTASNSSVFSTSVPFAGSNDNKGNFLSFLS